jgi:hypothetical protein
VPGRRRELQEGEGAIGDIVVLRLRMAGSCFYRRRRPLSHTQAGEASVHYCSICSPPRLSELARLCLCLARQTRLFSLLFVWATSWAKTTSSVQMWSRSSERAGQLSTGEDSCAKEDSCRPDRHVPLPSYHSCDRYTFHDVMGIR